MAQHHHPRLNDPSTPMSEEERIFIKQDNGQFIALKPSEVSIVHHPRGPQHMYGLPTQLSSAQRQDESTLYEDSETESERYQHQAVTSFH